MGRKYYSLEDKLNAIHDYLSGEKTIQQICEEIGMNYNASRGGAIRNWVRDYNKYGEMILYNKPHNKSYSAELKREAVESYLNGEGSMDDICLRYEIYSASILRRWIKKYNANRELKDYDPKREVYMAEARRKTTIC